jgi:cobalt-zinc-cadmium resistance protein CzcA
MDDAQRTLETALAGASRRRCGRASARSACGCCCRSTCATTREDRRGDDRSESGARIPMRDLCDDPGRERVATINREGNSRFLALKFNIEGRDMGRWSSDAIAAVEAKVKAPEGHYFVWGGEFENSSGRSRACGSSCRCAARGARPAVCRDELGAQRARDPADRCRSR